MNFHWKLAAAALNPAIRSMSHRCLPQVDGRIYSQELDSTVVISRDRWGIPRIQANSRHDLFFSQGFVHAQDRLWQMEVNRRAATGRLSEILGNEALQTDRLTRTLGFNRLAEIAWSNTSEKVRADVEAYTAGINAYLKLGRNLPVEFKMLNHRPEPWSVLDSVAFGRLMAWTLSHVWAAKFFRSQLIEAVGSELAAELEPQHWPGNPITLPKGIEFNRLEPDGMFQAAKGPLLGQATGGGARGSNGWVISPERSISGSAILCNDMHLPISSPSLWYFMDLQCRSDKDDLHVIGVTLPSVPYVLVGKNDRIAWGATVSFVDNEDLFLEKFAAEDQGLYEYLGQWRSAQQVEERIQIKGQKDHVERITITHHGPIISQILPSDGLALSLQSIALQPVESFAGIALLNEAGNWDDFVTAVRHIESPALNLLYADVKGNIGYYVSGRVPVRAKGYGQVPKPGWTGEHEWTGNVPFAEMPHALNPAQGFIVSANHRIVGDDYPHYLGRSWRNGFRARRIAEFITSRPKVSVEDCQRLQMDLMSVPGLELVRRLADLKTNNRDAALCLALLGEWEGWLGPDSVGGCVYQVFLERLAQSILKTKLSTILFDQFLGRGTNPVLYPVNEFFGQWPAILLQLLDNPDSHWLPAGPERERLFIRCLADTTVELRRLLGNDVNGWQWGRFHQIRMDHIFASQPPFDQVFSLGPMPIGGDADTVNQNSIIQDDPGDNIAPSYRQIIDLGNREASAAMHAPGQSGQLASPHYADLLQFWLDGRYYQMDTNKTTSNETEIKRLILSPPIGTY